MTPKEKAIDLVDKMTIDFDMCRGQNIKCALIAVDEIILSCLETTKLYENNDMINSDLSCQPLGYWEEVKTEINNL